MHRGPCMNIYISTQYIWICCVEIQFTWIIFCCANVSKCEHGKLTFSTSSGFQAISPWFTELFLIQASVEQSFQHDFLSWALWSLEGSQLRKLNFQMFSSHSLYLPTRLISLQINLDVLRRWEGLWYNLELSGSARLTYVEDGLMCSVLSLQTCQSLWVVWSVTKPSSDFQIS